MIDGLAVLAGALLGLGTADLPHASWAWSAAAAALCALLTPLRAAPGVRRLALLLASLAWASLGVIEWQQLRLAPQGNDARVLLEADIVTVPVRDGAELRFVAEVRVLEGQGAGETRRRARLAWRDPPLEPRVGECWRLLARLGRAEATANFAGPDLARAAFRDRVHLTAQVLPAALNARLALADDSIDGVRAWIALRIARAVPDRDAAGLITALAVGITAGMSVDQWRVFNATGTTHLVAISGLHVTLFALLAFFVARTLWRWLPMPRWLSRETFALTSGLAAAGGYALLAGLSVPTQRTWIMLATFACARLCARHVGAARTWSLALIAVLACDVFAPLAAGFWLSFTAVGVILLVEGSSLRVSSDATPRLWSALELQLAVMLSLAPLTFAVFGSVSLIGLLVNLVAIPVISFVFVPVVLAGALTAWWWPVADGMLFGVAEKLYEWLWPAMVWAADQDLAQWRAEPSPWWYALIVPAALLLIRRWPVSLRMTALAGAVPLLFAPSRLPDAGAFRLSVLDAGKGAAILVTTREHVLLFDTGDSWNTRGARAVQVVNPALDALGGRSIDLLILPALNPDRARGAAVLAGERGVQRIVTGGGWPGARLPVTKCADARFRRDGVEFETWSAGRSGAYCVLRVSSPAGAALLGGDLDTAAERELLARLAPRALHGDVVVLGRQAGAPGSSREWIESLGAGLAIATGGIAGSDTRARTIARWQAAGTRVLDTRREGGVEIEFGAHGIAVRPPARSARYPFAWRRFE